MGKSKRLGSSSASASERLPGHLAAAGTFAELTNAVLVGETGLEELLPWERDFLVLLSRAGSKKDQKTVARTLADAHILLQEQCLQKGGPATTTTTRKHPVVEAVAKALHRAVLDEQGESQLGAVRAVGLLRLAQAALASYKKAAETCLPELVIPWLAARAFVKHPAVASVAVETFDHAVPSDETRAKLCRSLRKHFFDVAKLAPKKAMAVYLNPLLVSLQVGALNETDSASMAEILALHLRKTPCHPSALRLAALSVLAMPDSLSPTILVSAATGSLKSGSPEAWELTLAIVFSGQTPPESTERAKMAKEISNTILDGNAMYDAIYPVIVRWKEGHDLEKVRDALEEHVLSCRETRQDAELSAAVETIEFFAKRSPENRKWAAEFASNLIVGELERGRIVIGRTAHIERALKSLFNIRGPTDTAKSIIVALATTPSPSVFRANHRLLQAMDRLTFEPLIHAWCCQILEVSLQDVSFEALPEAGVQLLSHIVHQVPESVTQEQASQIAPRVTRQFLTTIGGNEANLLFALGKIDKLYLSMIGENANVLSPHHLATLADSFDSGFLDGFELEDRVTALTHSAETEQDIGHLISAVWCRESGLSVGQDTKEMLFTEKILHFVPRMLDFVRAVRGSHPGPQEARLLFRCLLSPELNEKLADSVVDGLRDSVTLGVKVITDVLESTDLERCISLVGSSLARIAGDDTEWLLLVLQTFMKSSHVTLDDIILGAIPTTMPDRLALFGSGTRAPRIKEFVDLLLALEVPKNLVNPSVITEKAEDREFFEAVALNLCQRVFTLELSPESLRLALQSCCSNRTHVAESVIEMLWRSGPAGNNLSSRLSRVVLESEGLDLGSEIIQKHIRQHLSVIGNSTDVTSLKGSRTAIWSILWRHGDEFQTELWRANARSVARLEQELSMNPKICEVHEVVLGIFVHSARHCEMDSQDFTRLASLATRLLSCTRDTEVRFRMAVLFFASQLLQHARPTQPASVRQDLKDSAIGVSGSLISELIEYLATCGDRDWESEATMLILSTDDLANVTELLPCSDDIRWNALDSAASWIESDPSLGQALLNYAIATGPPLEFGSCSENDDDDKDRQNMMTWLPQPLQDRLIRSDRNEERPCSRVLAWIYVLEMVGRHQGSPDAKVQQRLVDFRKSILRLLRLSNTLFPDAVEDFFEFASKKKVTSPEIQKVCLQALSLSLEVVPGLSRLWFSEGLSRAQSSMVKEFVRRNLSTGLIETEIQKLKDLTADQGRRLSSSPATMEKESDGAEDAGDLKIKASVVGREAKASYILSDVSIDIILRLPDCHPLEPVEVEAGQRIGMSEKMWRKTLLGITKLVTLQSGGTLAQAVELWRRNLDKTFAGVEDCPICYSVLHLTTGALPKLSCGTCSAKFHSACLCKWFATSNTSTCPMCRSAF